jgi:gluconolactonase
MSILHVSRGVCRLRSSGVGKLTVLPLLLAALACGSDDDDTSDGEQMQMPALTPVVVMPAAATPAAMPAAAMPAAAMPMPPATETTASAIDGVVTEGARIVVIGEGFMGTEGPITLPDGDLIFTETNANRITRIDENDALDTFLENTNGSNALGFDADGRLISVQTTPGNTLVGVIYPPGSEAVLSDNFEGKPYGRPNDLVVSTQGGVYFTEPGPNAPADGSTPPPPALTPAVYYIPPGEAALRVAEGIERPNGIILSVDEQTLYVNNTQGRYLIAFDVEPDGTLSNRRDFAEYEGVTTNANGTLASGADGLGIDSQGRLYAATTAGVQVFSPEGEHLGTLPVSRAPQNIAFAGPDKRTLYIVGRGAAYRVTLEAQGFEGRAK